MILEEQEIKKALMFIQAAGRDARKCAEKALEIASKPITRISRGEVTVRLNAMQEVGWFNSRAAAYDNAAVILEEAIKKASALAGGQ